MDDSAAAGSKEMLGTVVSTVKGGHRASSLPCWEEQGRHCHTDMVLCAEVRRHRLVPHKLT